MASGDNFPWVKRPRRGNDTLQPSSSRVPGTMLQLHHTPSQHRENFTFLWTCIFRSKPDGVTYIHCLLDKASRRRPVCHASLRSVLSSLVLMSHFRTPTKLIYTSQLLLHAQTFCLSNPNFAFHVVTIDRVWIADSLHASLLQPAVSSLVTAPTMAFPLSLRSSPLSTDSSTELN